MKPSLITIGVQRGLASLSAPVKTSLTVATVLIGISTLPVFAATTDTQAPIIKVFNVPPVVNSLTVPITTFVASDNTGGSGLGGYQITLTAIAPIAAASWNPQPPRSFTLPPNSSGQKTLYAWAKDRAGNVSASSAASVMVDTTAPMVSAFSISAQNNNPTVQITALTATDNIAVSGYLITDKTNPPRPTDPNWQSTSPTTFQAKPGVKVLYAWARDGAGNVSKPVSANLSPISTDSSAFTMTQTLSDQAQRTTLAFSGLALMTGNLNAQSFFPPGKVADYTGFQYLRDNDPDHMGHNTSFLTRVANNVIYILNDTQFAQLRTLAVNQTADINLYGYKRFTLMHAFRRLIDGDLPTGATDLNLNAVKNASEALYKIDGQISFDRALLYANILNSLDSTQTAYLAGMKGKGWKSWSNITNNQVDSKMRGLPQGTAVAVMTYASDLFSWYAGSVDADVYFCPERHGTYYGGFYIKDAPAIGHEGYSINEQLTATAGAALSDSSKGYVTQAQATVMSSLVDTQRQNLAAIVQVRTGIAKLLRGLLTSTANSDAIRGQVLELSKTYGDLDGENNYNYARVFAEVYGNLSDVQRGKLADLRHSILSGIYSDGTPFDYSVATTPYLYSAPIVDQSVLAPYITAADQIFFDPQL